MKYVLTAAIALVVGVILGAIPFKIQASNAQAELAAKEAECHKGGVGKDIAGLLAQGASQRRQLREPTPEEIEANDANNDDLLEGDTEDTEGIQVEFGEDRERPRDWGDEEISMAREALELRRTQAMASLVEDADPSDEQRADIDKALADMNDELRGMAEELVEMVNAGEEPDRREAMEFAADALDLFLETEDRILGSLDPEQVEALEDEAHDPFSFIDPAILDLLEEIDR